MSRKSSKDSIQQGQGTTSRLPLTLEQAAGIQSKLTSKYEDVSIIGTKEAPVVHARLHNSRINRHPKYRRPWKRVCRNVWLRIKKDHEDGMLYAVGEQDSKYPTFVSYAVIEMDTDRVLYYEKPGQTSRKGRLHHG